MKRQQDVSRGSLIERRGLDETEIIRRYRGSRPERGFLRRSCSDSWVEGCPRFEHSGALSGHENTVLQPKFEFCVLSKGKQYIYSDF
jgi:hypothetical protein